MPRKGPAYPISPEWRRQVRAAINAIIADDARDDVTSDATFARSAGIAKSSLTEMLDEESTQTTVMREVNTALGWPAPRVLCTPDELEIFAAVEALDDREIGRLLERAEQRLKALKKQKSQRS